MAVLYRHVRLQSTPQFLPATLTNPPRLSLRFRIIIQVDRKLGLSNSRCWLCVRGCKTHSRFVDSSATLVAGSARIVVAELHFILAALIWQRLHCAPPGDICSHASRATPLACITWYTAVAPGSCSLIIACNELEPGTRVLSVGPGRPAARRMRRGSRARKRNLCI